MKSVKLIAVAALALGAAACQSTSGGYSNTTQQVFGNAQPNVPANWTRSVTSNGFIAYACPVTRCNEPGVVLYSARRFDHNMEYLVRKRVVTAGLLEEMSKSYSHYTDGKISASSVRNITNKRIAGFESVRTFSTTRGTAYSVTRFTFDGNDGRGVGGAALSMSKARRNMQLGVQGAQ